VLGKIGSAQGSKAAPYQSVSDMVLKPSSEWSRTRIAEGPTRSAAARCRIFRVPIATHLPSAGEIEARGRNPRAFVC
jgi:hypothetical protein